MDVTAARPVRCRGGRPVMREIPVTIIKDFTVTTALTSRGTKKECVRVSDLTYSFTVTYYIKNNLIYVNVT